MSGIEVAGARGQIPDPDELYGQLNSIGEGSVVALNPEMVCGIDHLLSAAEHAVRAFERGTNSSSSLGLETVLYASGERQIVKALDKMGVRPGSQAVALVLFDLDPDRVIEKLDLKRDDEILDCTRSKLREFGIPKEELDALPSDMAIDLVLERVAFVELIKR
jgi:KEOPS complex subunit Cgi121